MFVLFVGEKVDFDNLGYDGLVFFLYVKFDVDWCNLFCCDGDCYECFFVF